MKRNPRKLIPYKPYLKELARKLRNNSTLSEIKLWKVLKGKYQNKYDFHRQKPLDNYIADFFCFKLYLVIEIDGISHENEENIQRDFEKECALNSYGVNVLRLADDDLHHNLPACIELIDSYIDAFESRDFSLFTVENWNINPLKKSLISSSWPTPLNPYSGIIAHPEL